MNTRRIEIIKFLATNDFRFQLKTYDFEKNKTEQKKKIRSKTNETFELKRNNQLK